MISRHRSIGLVAGLALALVASSCASGDPEPGASPPGERVSGSAPSVTQSPTTDAQGGGGGAGEGANGSAPVPEILAFEAPLVGGGTLKGAELAGAPVAVWFWAPW